MLSSTLHRDRKPGATAAILRGCFAAVAAICSCGLAGAEPADSFVKEPTRATPDKSVFNLFNPVPEDLMRELAADRPDKTDCPFTVDAGHFQIEMDFANLTYNRPNFQRGNTRFTAVDIAPVNIKAGLLNNLDFQLVFTSFRTEKTEDLDTGTIRRKSGFDGITPRFKLNVCGNDGGFFALGLIPFVKLPVNTDDLGNDFVEGGVAVPYSFEVSGWDIGLQATFRANRDDAGGGYHAELDNSISIGHSLIGKLSIAAEFFSSVSTERDAEWAGTVDTWLTYQINKDLRLDGGVYIGVTLAADDWHPWLGMTWRF
jgi:Putative MetA-pathway of phenol degradation